MLRAVGFAVAVSVVWIAGVIAGTLGGWGRVPLAARGDLGAFAAAVEARLDAECGGNAVLVLMQAGRVAYTGDCTLGVPVDRTSVFQAASLSKWISAWGVMKLVEEGRVELDAPVEDYVVRWRVPESAFDSAGITIRRLLSHTAGLTDGLGYDGFAPGEPIQSLPDSLTRAKDAMPGASGTVRLGRAPGRRWQYSGGGYTLLQLLIEDVTGEDFAAYMERSVLQPLGMRQSSFDVRRIPDAALAEVYDAQATPTRYRRYTALAAASLFTSASDLVRFLQAQRPGPNGEPIGRGVLRPETVEAMSEPQAFRFGRAIWGLGPILYAEAAKDRYVLGHEGQNAPAINHTVRLDPTTGDAIVVLQSGRPGLASALGGEWVWWKTGRVGVVDLSQGLDRLPWLILAGLAVVAIATGFGLRRSGRRAAG